MKKKLIISLICILVIICAGCSNVKVEFVPKQNITVEKTWCTLTVEYIDVGQADSILINCDNEYMLIDGGNVGDSDLIYTILKNNNINYLKYVINTHRDEDHCGGLAGALSYAKAGAVYSSCDDYTTKCFKNFKAKVEAQNLEIIVPTDTVELSLGDAKVELLITSEEFRQTNDYIKNANNQSIVVKITHGECTFLFAGDCEIEAEEDLLNKYGDKLTDIDVLKVGHHGSDTATSYLWLRTIMPKIAVISCGKNNKYGHPHQATLDKLNQAEVIYYRTDELGDIFITSDGKDVKYQE